MRHHDISRVRTLAGWTSMRRSSRPWCGEREVLAVEAEQVEDRGVEVGDVAAVGDGVVAEIVGRAIGLAAFDPAAGKPDGESVWVVVAAVLALRARGPAELASPEDQGLVRAGRAASSRSADPAIGRVGLLRSKSACRRRCWRACPMAGPP